MGHELFRDGGQVAHAHVKQQGADPGGEFGPVKAGHLFGRIFVPGDQAQAGGKIAVGQGNPGIDGRSEPRCNARHNLEPLSGIG